MAEIKSAVTSRNTYSAKDVAVYLGISLSNSYNLMNSKGFPSMNIGCKRIMVTKEAFEAWVKEQQRIRA